MKIVTISREFGSGGRELAGRLAELLGFDCYDREIISAVARGRGVDEDYVGRVLGEHGWSSYPLTFRNTLGSSAYMRAGRIDLLVEQKRVLEEIAALGRDCVIVGRNADVILRAYRPLSVFVCAATDAQVKRCVERSPEGERLSERQLVRRIKRIDEMRARTRAVLSGSEWGRRDGYHLTVNTGGRSLKGLAEAVAGFADVFWRTAE